MELINILVLWVTLGLIMISINKNGNQTKDVKKEEVKVRKNIFSIIIEKIKSEKAKNKPESNVTIEATENSTLSSEAEVQSSKGAINTVPKMKKGEIFVADFESQNQNTENNQVEAVEESIVEPIEDAIEEIENSEGIITATEVEDDDDEPFINLGEEVEEVFNNIFSGKNLNQAPVYTSDFDVEEVGEYNTFATSEEPWYEHPSVRKLIENNNDILKKEPKKFEIIERSY